jgi:hypothetical protein
MNNKPTMKELYELVRLHDEKIELPDIIQFSKLSRYSFHIDKIKKEVHEYNRFSTDPKESLKHLKVLTRTLLELLEEMGEDKLVIFHNHRLEIKKKDYVIKGLKDFIASRDELDDEIPTDDDDSKDGKDEKEPKGLSKKELEIMKKFKV